MKITDQSLSVVLLAIIAAVSPCLADGPYRFSKEIPIGGTGSWDYLTIDQASHRLYVTHETEIVAIDLIKELVIGHITNTPGVHHFVLAPELGRGFCSNGTEAKLSIIDLKNLNAISKLKTGHGPDVLLYE